MFHIALFKEALGEEALGAIPHSLLGSIVECHCRGLLPSRYAYEYQISIDDLTIEIDHVDPINTLAVEFTISDSHTDHFDLLSPEYRCILLTRSQNQPKKAKTGKGSVSYPLF